MAISKQLPHVRSGIDEIYYPSVMVILVHCTLILISGFLVLCMKVSLLYCAVLLNLQPTTTTPRDGLGPSTQRGRPDS